MMFSEKENFGKGGLGGHASNQSPVVIESPAVYKYSPITNAGAHPGDDGRGTGKTT